MPKIDPLPDGKQPWPQDPAIRKIKATDGTIISLRWTVDGLAIEMGQGIGLLRDERSPL